MAEGVNYNLVVVFSPDKTKLLMCRRLKEPYLGLSNFVGGKIEEGEDGLDAAYRELWEETGAEDARIRPVCIYAVNRDGVPTYGLLCFAEVTTLGSIPPESEIAESEETAPLTKQPAGWWVRKRPWG
jgi:ADP-ribose pyrophosphatase YjhB (NUDIX family)